MKKIRLFIYIIIGTLILFGCSTKESMVSSTNKTEVIENSQFEEQVKDLQNEINIKDNEIIKLREELAQSKDEINNLKEENRTLLNDLLDSQNEAKELYKVINENSNNIIIKNSENENIDDNYSNQTSTLDTANIDYNIRGYWESVDPDSNYEVPMAISFTESVGDYIGNISIITHSRRKVKGTCEIFKEETDENGIRYGVEVSKGILDSSKAIITSFYIKNDGKLYLGQFPYKRIDRNTYEGLIK